MTASQPALPTDPRPPSWHGRALCALGAVYGPFLAALVYLLGWGHCSHCTETWVTLFPLLPGLMPAQLFAGRLRALSPVPGWAVFAIAALNTVALLAVVVYCGGPSRRRRQVALGIAAMVCTGLMLATLALIRA